MSGRPWRRPAPYVCIPNERLEALRDVAPDAMGLDYAAWLYVSQHHTDGLLTDAQVRRLPLWSARRQDHLVRAGAWRLASGGVEIPDYLLYNQDLATIRRIRDSRSHPNDGLRDDDQAEGAEPLNDRQQVDVEPTLDGRRGSNGPTPGPTPGGAEKPSPARTADKVPNKVHDTLCEPPTPKPAESPAAASALASRGSDQMRGAPPSTAVSALRPGQGERDDDQENDGVERPATHVLQTRADRAFATDLAFKEPRSHHGSASVTTAERAPPVQRRRCDHAAATARDRHRRDHRRHRDARRACRTEERNR